MFLIVYTNKRSFSITIVVVYKLDFYTIILSKLKLYKNIQYYSTILTLKS
jgi:hypothetical protein